MMPKKKSLCGEGEALNLFLSIFILNNCIKEYMVENQQNMLRRMNAYERAFEELTGLTD